MYTFVQYFPVVGCIHNDLFYIGHWAVAFFTVFLFSRLWSGLSSGKNLSNKLRICFHTLVPRNGPPPLPLVTTAFIGNLFWVVL